jgi:hypothetical protein
MSEANNSPRSKISEPLSARPKLSQDRDSMNLSPTDAGNNNKFVKSMPITSVQSRKASVTGNFPCNDKIKNELKSF